MAERCRFLLVDGSATMYRAFYAIRTLSTRAGLPTNALYGFIRMLSQMREVWAPTHWMVIFDGGSPPRRLEALPEYKAQRAPMPDELRSQIPLIERYLDCARVDSLRVNKEEADDVMATLATRASRDGGEVLLATSDKDMYQLVDAQVHVVTVAGKPERMDPEAVRAKTGVLPEHIIPWLALIGDTADNIPGVPGVGPKTAAALLGEYGSVDALMAKVESVARPKLREALQGHTGTVTRNLELVRLETDLDLPFSWSDAVVRNGDHAALLSFFEEMEFGTLAKALREPDLFDM
jgi:DNA polymerase-1